MFTDRGPGMEIPGTEGVITLRPWDQLRGGDELEREGEPGGGQEHGHVQELDERVGNKEQGRETINMFSDQGHWMEIL